MLLPESALASELPDRAAAVRASVQSAVDRRRARSCLQRRHARWAGTKLGDLLSAHAAAVRVSTAMCRARFLGAGRPISTFYLSRRGNEDQRHRRRRSCYAAFSRRTQDMWRPRSPPFRPYEFCSCGRLGLSSLSAPGRGIAINSLRPQDKQK